MKTSDDEEDFVPNSEKYAARVRERIGSDNLWKSAAVYALMAIYELLKERLPVPAAEEKEERCQS